MTWKSKSDWHDLILKCFRMQKLNWEMPERSKARDNPDKFGGKFSFVLCGEMKNKSLECLGRNLWGKEEDSG
jgi:hypothetical protein